MKAWMLWKEETAREVPEDGCFACSYVNQAGAIDEGVGWIKAENGKIMRCETLNVFDEAGRRGTMMACELATEEEAREEFDMMARDGWEMNIAPPAKGPQN